MAKKPLLCPLKEDVLNSMRGTMLENPPYCRCPGSKNEGLENSLVADHLPDRHEEAVGSVLSTAKQTKYRRGLLCTLKSSIVVDLEQKDKWCHGQQQLQHCCITNTLQIFTLNTTDAGLPHFQLSGCRWILFQAGNSRTRGQSRLPAEFRSPLFRSTPTWVSSCTRIQSSQNRSKE